MTSTPLDRRPLESFDGFEIGRQVKLGPTIQDARTLIPAVPPSIMEIEAAGYRGTIDQYLTSTSRFPVTIPEGTRGLVLNLQGSNNTAAVAFIWKTPKSEKITAAVVWIGAYYLVNHRGAPPLPGEKIAQQPQTTTPAATLTNPAAPTMSALETALATIVTAQVDAKLALMEETIAQLVTSANSGPVTHHVKINHAEPVTLTRRPHEALSKVLARMQMKKPDGGRFNLMLTGDAGTGKSSLAKDAAAALSLPFASLCLSGGITEGALIGRTTQSLSTGQEHYKPSPLVRSFRDGGVFLLDEMDGADENTLLVLNTILDAQEWHAPDGQVIARHDNHYVIGGANTYGTGASRTFNGRNQLDGAFLNRWRLVEVDYDQQLEQMITKSKQLTERLQSARKKLREAQVSRWITTRDILFADACANQLSMSETEIMAEVTTGWTDEDRHIAGLR